MRVLWKPFSLKRKRTNTRESELAGRGREHGRVSWQGEGEKGQKCCKSSPQLIHVQCTSVDVPTVKVWATEIFTSVIMITHKPEGPR